MSCLDVMSNSCYAIICSLYCYQKRLVFPPFIPNDYFFEKFKDKKLEKGQLYAWAVREVMSQYSGLPTDDFIDLKKKEEYMVKKKLMKPRTPKGLEMTDEQTAK